MVTSSSKAASEHSATSKIPLKSSKKAVSAASDSPTQTRRKRKRKTFHPHFRLRKATSYKLIRL